jgi:hypothetical protein
VPRPKRPEPLPWTLDRHCADVANLSLSDYRTDLRPHVARLIARYLANWKARKGPGRRDETESGRNALIVALANAFRNHSSWDSRDHEPKDYRENLIAFLRIVLAANSIPCGPSRLLRILSTKEHGPLLTPR